MRNKNSVIFLKDWEVLVSSLPNDKQLIFWGLFMSYPNSVCEDNFVKPIWLFVENQLNKMNETYEETIVKRNRANGAKGGRPKSTPDNQDVTDTQTIPENPVGYLKPNLSQKTLNENENKNKNKNENENNIKFNFKKSLINYGFDKKLVDDWIKVRKDKRASNTETAFNSFINEVKKRDVNINELLELIVVKNWSGFKWEWYDNVNKGKQSDVGFQKPNTNDSKFFVTESGIKIQRGII